MASVDEIGREINAGKFRPAYYFFGEDDYRISEAIKFITHKYLPDRQRITNYRAVDGAHTRIADLLAELATVPMLGERLVVAVANYQSYKDSDRKRILAMLSPTDPHRVVIFSSPADKAPHKKSALMESLGSAGVAVIEVKRLKEAQVESHVRTAFKNAGISIESEAMKLLLELVAGSRGGMDAEISKLINFKNRDETITVDDVRKLCSGYEVYKVFDLADKLIEGKRDMALRTLESLIAEGNAGQQIAAVLQGHFISLYLVKAHRQPLGNRIKIIARLRGQASRFSLSQLEQIIVDLADLDAEVRRNPIGDAAVLREAILKFGTRG